MKDWCSKWIMSIRRNKQRKYRYNAPQHIRTKLVSAPLSKELKEKIKKRRLPLRTKDYVKVMRGSFKGISGEISEIDFKNYKIHINGVQKKKVDGSEVRIAIDPSNVMITSLYLEDDKRLKRIKLSQKIKEAIKTKRPESEKEVKEEEEGKTGKEEDKEKVKEEKEREEAESKKEYKEEEEKIEERKEVKESETEVKEIESAKKGEDKHKEKKATKEGKKDETKIVRDGEERKNNKESKKNGNKVKTKKTSKEVEK